MSAIVTSPQDQDWYTNGRGWWIILERAARDLGPGERDEFDSCVDSIGVNFTLLDPAVHAKVAGWLLPAVEALAGPEAAEHGWESAESRDHLGELVLMLRAVHMLSTG